MKKALFVLLALFAITELFAQKQPVVAVAPFEIISGVSETDAAMITDVFFVRLGNTRKVDLVNRTIVQRIIKEHNFQLEDWSNKDKTAELGKALNADWIVQGDIRKMNNGILIIVQFYNINTFKFEGGTDLRLANADEAYDKMNPLVDSLIQTIAASPVTQQPPQVTTTSGYKIGDTGPSGGIIFLIEGNLYYECSKSSLGKFNWNDAKKATSQYRGGGYSDWRLPTTIELRSIYQIRGKLTIYYRDWHWSSQEAPRERAGSRAWAYSFMNDCEEIAYRDQELYTIVVRTFRR